jgi:hypothetical protein
MVDLAELKMHMRDVNLRAKVKQKIVDMRQKALEQEELNVGNPDVTASIAPSGSSTMTPLGPQPQTSLPPSGTFADDISSPPPSDIDPDLISSDRNPSNWALSQLTERLFQQLDDDTAGESPSPPRATVKYPLDLLFNFSSPFWQEKTFWTGAEQNITQERSVYEQLNADFTPSEEHVIFEMDNTLQSSFGM